MTVQQRIDTALAHIVEIGARPIRIVLAKTDLPEVGGRGDYKGIPVIEGEVGGHSFIATANAPSGGGTDFEI